jgi:hypothetical protein
MEHMLTPGKCAEASRRSDAIRRWFCIESLIWLPCTRYIDIELQLLLKWPFQCLSNLKVEIGSDSDSDVTVCAYYSTYVMRRSSLYNCYGLGRSLYNCYGLGLGCCVQWVIYIGTLQVQVPYPVGRIASGDRDSSNLQTRLDDHLRLSMRPARSTPWPAAGADSSTVWQGRTREKTRNGPGFTATRRTVTPASHGPARTRGRVWTLSDSE